MIRHRRMTPDDLRLVLDWAAEEGWNPGVDDAEAFIAADPDGFHLAEEGGTPVAAISVVNHSEDFAFLGLYLCRPEFRGKGIGLDLWNAALAHAGTRTVGLDGVPAQQGNYVKSGFVHAGETARYFGTLPAGETSGVRLATEEDRPHLIAREAEASGVLKPAYMSEWFRTTEARCTLVAEGDGDPGFATVRRCRSGAKIGPLIADDDRTARELILACASTFGGPIMIDVPSGSTRLAAVCTSLGLTVTFRTARMYRGTAIASASDIYAVATLELG